jgi:hypothetical protein
VRLLDVDDGGTFEQILAIVVKIDDGRMRKARDRRCSQSVFPSQTANWRAIEGLRRRELAVGYQKKQSWKSVDDSDRQCDS